MSKDMKGCGMGDWVDMKNARQKRRAPRAAQPARARGLPRQTNRFRRRDLQRSVDLHALRPPHLILQRLLGLSHEDLKIVWGLVQRFESKDLELKKASEDL